MTFHAVFEMIVATPGDTYVKVHELTSQPMHPLLAPDLLEIILGQWWILPSEESEGPDVMLTPNPNLIKAQSEVVRVTSDLGFDHIQGRMAYHYEVEVDSEKLIYTTSDYQKSP